MENKEINKLHSIDYQNIDKSNYTYTLLNEAYRVGILNESQFESVQTQILKLLSDSILKYTHGQSSSVRNETAENIFLSYFYSIDTYLLSQYTVDESIMVLKEKSLEEIYQKAKKLLKVYTLQSQKLLNDIKNSRLPVEMIAYNMTIDEAFSDFFANYDVDFNAHDNGASIDYPLAFDDMEAKGISYIKKYLEKLKLENEFCSAFEAEDINNLLSSYAETYQTNVKDLMINIFELIFNNCVVSILLGKSAKDLTISQGESEYLYGELKKIRFAEYENMVKNAVDKLIIDISIMNPKLVEYIRKQQYIFSKKLIDSVERNWLQSFITLRKEKVQSEIIYNTGLKMGNERFRIIIEKVMECESAEEKSEIIRNNINSFDDFTDLLDADCLFGDDYTHVFNRLSDFEISLLCSKVFEEEKRNGLIRKAAILCDSLKEKEWQNKFISYLKNISIEKINKIIIMINKI